MTGYEAMEILLAEDSDQDAELTQRALKRGNILNKLVRVKDGAEAIDVLKKIRADERTRTIPVVVLTSSAEERDMVESYRLGVNSYLVKPVETEKFVDVVTRAGQYWMLMNRTP